jgi:cell division protein FtsI (penicillin-binding protein 3)
MIRKDNPSSNSSDRKRLLGLACFIFALFALLITRFYYIQVVEGERWVKEANRQHYFVVTEPFQRGTFYSNTSIKRSHPEIPQKMVFDIEKFHLFVDPVSIPEAQRTIMIQKLGLFLGMSTDPEKNKLSAQFSIKSRKRILARGLEKEKKEQILTWWNAHAKQERLPRNGLYFVADYQRSYPFGKLLGQVLHTVQTIKDEKTLQAYPTGGLELSFHNYLKGKLGKRRLMRSPRNSFETGDVIIPPEHGADIYLTINHCLQAIAEEELAKGVKKVKAKSGWAVMLEPHTGEVLALAQYPFFHPLEYKTYFNDPSLLEHTRVKTIYDTNEPGSVMKPVSMAIGLQANKVLKAKGEKEIFHPEDKTPTWDSRFKGRKNLPDTRLHYYLNMNMAIKKSSNIYVARLIEKVVDRLGPDWYKQQLHQTFGFGEKTSIELPAENPGLVPTPGKKHPNGALEWSVSTPPSLAMGYNILINTLQLTRAYAVFANGGYLVQPTLIRKIVKNGEKGSSEILLDYTQEDRLKSFPHVLDDDIVKLVTMAMKFTTKPGGSAPRAEIWGYTECGKTGTAEKFINGRYSRTLNCSTFVGFTPVQKTAFVLAVTLNEPEISYLPGIGKIQLGGGCAAPVFREIAKRSLEYLGIPPDDPHGYPVGDPRHNHEKADWLPENRRLQEMYEKWNNNPKICDLNSVR